ncbi:MAG: WD40-like Beta Propeller Repeat [Bacteroidetes bacterium]|jgi:tetratricopeptide (TPR) repeat protein|nr:WD40-like Beta Propeller Repeat [Bacteroidota bacterium]
MSKNLLVLFVSVLLLVSDLTKAQGDDAVLTKSDPKEAEKKLIAGNYDEALDDFLSLHESDPSNDKYTYNIAVCYLNINGNKSKAIPYLEKTVRYPKHDPNAEYLLGRAYHYANRFDDAVTSFNKFKTTGKGTAENLKDADHQIQYCLNAKELMKFPADVKFENLGGNVNSEYGDHFPFIPFDESFVIFNTNRPEKNAYKEENGDYKNSIYVSEVKDGEYQKAYLIGTPICKGNTGEEVIGLSANGKTMLIYMKDPKGAGNIYISEKDDAGNFRKPVLLDKNINTPSDEIAASLTAEGDMIYFASNRAGGLGGIDIYMSRKQPNGSWSVPMNMGPIVNTPYDEDFPNISQDGKVLFFSSKGHTSMGGYDIFKVSYNDETSAWENAKNIGYPVNTTGDDMNFRSSKNARYGYISSLREGGMGDYDIYRVIFNDVEPELSVLKGNVLSEDGTQINYPDVLMSVTNNKTKELVGTYLPNSNTGKYVMILPPGDYTMEVEIYGFIIAKRKLEIKDKISYQSEIELDLKLQVQK